MKLIKVLILCGVFFLHALFPSSIQADSSREPGKLTVIVSSCDKYAELWGGFFQLLFRNWPALKDSAQQIPLLLIANNKSYPDPAVKTILINNEKAWSDNMLDTLDKVKSEYVLILLEDYYITKFDEKRFQEILKYMVENKHISYIELHPEISTLEGKAVMVPHLPGARYKGRYEDFRTSLQASLWRKDDLALLLRRGESAWAFETQGSIRSQGLRGEFIVMMEQPSIEYLNMAQQGYLNAENIRKAKALGVEIKDRSLPLDEDHRVRIWFKITLPRILYFQLVVPCERAFQWIFG